MGLLPDRHHQLNFYGLGRAQDSTCTRYATCRGRHEGIIHILWDCEGAAKCWAYIVAQWTCMDVKPAQLFAYKAAVLSRTAPDLPPAVREEIGRIFPETAEEIRRAWVRIWWIACSICFATLWVQRNRWVHKHEETTVDQAESELRHTLLRQLQAVAIREHRFNRDGDDCVFFRLATELFRAPVTQHPITRYEPGRQLTSPVGVLERLETFQLS